MRVQVGDFIERARSSLWPWPALAVALAIGLGFGLPWLDRQLAIRHEAWWFLFDGGPESARDLLSTIVASMITFNGIVFSITVLVLQLASTQFSPRVIRTFLHEPVTKLAMAAFAGTFVYAMVVLTRVRSAPEEMVPRLSVWVAVALVMLSTGIFLAYVERMAHSVRAITVLSKVGAETRTAIDRNYPAQMEPNAEHDSRLPERPADRVVGSLEAPGSITSVDVDELVELAVRCDAVFELVARVGDFVPSGAPIFRVWSEAKVDDAALLRQVRLAPERTPYQDVGFGLRQLVDVALRALSPGVNDPTTAVQAIDHLHDLMRQITLRALPREAHLDEQGTLRVLLRQAGYAELVGVAFDEIIQSGHESIQVHARLRSALLDCMSLATPERSWVLQSRLTLLDGLSSPREATGVARTH